MRTAVPLTVLTTALACSFVTAPAHARARPRRLKASLDVRFAPKAAATATDWRVR